MPLSAIARTWPLLLGMGVLMLGAGLQSTLLGLRATLDGFPTLVTGFVMSCYYVGYVIGTIVAPPLLRRLGHIRVFATLAAVASVAILVQGCLVNPVTWGAMRLLSGVCFAGIYVVAESWLNDRASRANRGRVFAIYMLVLYVGLGAAQFLLILANPRTATPFMLVSILISLAMVPIVVSAQQVPDHAVPRKVRLRDLYSNSPLGVVAVTVSGLISAIIFSMGPVYARLSGLETRGVAAFMAASILAAVVTQYPVGRLSDRIDRRTVIAAVCTLAMVTAGSIVAFPDMPHALFLGLAALFSGFALTLYSLSVSHVNDKLEPAQMVAASSALLLLNGTAAAIGPVLAGSLIAAFGPSAYFATLATLSGALAIYDLWRKARRRPVPRPKKVLSSAPSPEHDPAATGAMDSAGAKHDHVALRLCSCPCRRMHLQKLKSLVPAALLVLLSTRLSAAESVDANVAVTTKIDEPKLITFKPELQASKGTVTLAGKRLDYDAYAGTLVVHLKGYDDVPQNINKEDKIGPSEASMFYVAYFKSGAPSTHRPITFLFNGGPGSPTVWLHMGAFGPRRVVTADDAHTPAAPYDLVNNEYSLLDASDLVFIDAPGTGFSRVAGKDKEKAFFGVDPDAHAFAEFITAFLSKWGRWNSPKYIFGESYGTTRAANVVNLLVTRNSVDVNGVILLSQCLNYDVLPDYPELNPAVDLPYELWLPSYAATAWYHHRLTETPKDLASLVDEVEHFASGQYASALQAGATLDPAERKIVAEKLHGYTGIPLAYIEKANLRISGGEFRKTLLDDAELTTGELDTRFSGPTLDPMSKEAGYDPQSAAIGSAYISVFNDYVRRELKFGDGKIYRESLDIEEEWDFSHRPPGARETLKQQVNVMPDLASAMKHDPNLKILVNGGYFDLSTPFFEGIYEMRHLPIPATLQKNIDFRFYDSGHMVYAHEASLKTLHDNVAEFIRRTLTH